MAAIDKDAIDQLNDLKAVNDLITSSLESDLVLLQAKHKSTAEELEQKSSHLVATILANNKFLNGDTTLKDTQGPDDEETRKTLEILKEVHTATTPTSLLKMLEILIFLPGSFVQFLNFS